MAAAVSVDPWDQGGTYTREQLEEFRGPLDGTGHGPPEVSNGLETPPVGACLQCQTPLHRADQKYCSGACRSRWRRAHLEPAEIRNGKEAETVTEPGGIFPPVLPGPFEQLVAVAQGLPAGWRLEATADTVLLAWTRCVTEPYGRPKTSVT